jgi:hypothetical protein
MICKKKKHTEITDKIADTFNSQVRFPLKIFTGAQYALLAFGVCLLGLSILGHYVRRKRQMSSYVSLNVNDSSTAATSSDETTNPSEATPLIKN